MTGLCLKHGIPTDSPDSPISGSPFSSGDENDDVCINIPKKKSKIDPFAQSPSSPIGRLLFGESKFLTPDPLFGDISQTSSVTETSCDLYSSKSDDPRDYGRHGFKYIPKISKFYFQPASNFIQKLIEEEIPQDDSPKKDSCVENASAPQEEKQDLDDFHFPPLKKDDMKKMSPSHKNSLCFQRKCSSSPESSESFQNSTFGPKNRVINEIIRDEEEMICERNKIRRRVSCPDPEGPADTSVLMNKLGFSDSLAYYVFIKSLKGAIKVPILH